MCNFVLWLKAVNLREEEAYSLISVVVFYASTDSFLLRQLMTMKYCSNQCRIKDLVVQFLMVAWNYKLMNVECCV